MHTGATPGGLFLGGVYFDGPDIYAATDEGMLLSSGGAAFVPYALPGFPTGQAIASIAAGAANGAVRFVIVTVSTVNNHAVPGNWYSKYTGTYCADLGGSWAPCAAGLGSGDQMAFVAMAHNDPLNVYAIGYNTAAYSLKVYKSTDGGSAWQPSLITSGNQNVATGWAGQQADPANGARWWNGWGQFVRGLAVSPVDANIAGFTDGGFTHVTSDGGASWRQVYVPPAQENSAGALVPHPKAYASNGFENTVAHWIVWLDTQRLVAGFSDIQGMYSSDGGGSWTMLNSDAGTPGTPTPDGLKDFNQLVIDPLTDSVYASTASVGPLYRAPIVTDAFLDRPGGRIVRSDDGGATWTTLYDFGYAVATLALDPTDPDRMYAGVVHSTQGGIYVCDDIHAVVPVFAPVAAQLDPRMEGHPQRIRVLSDGAVVAAFSERKPTNQSPFNATSGVFVLPAGSMQWEDRSDPALYHYTRDLVIDPHDESVWYATTFTSWNNPGGGNIAGGLYRTVDSGVSWQPLLAQSAESCTVNPDDPNEMYVTVDRGLWHTADLRASTPTFVEVESYPFGGPERVFFEPGDSSQVWVTNFGNGIRRGMTASPPAAGCASGSTVSKAKLALRETPFRLRASGEALLPKPWAGLDPVAFGVSLSIASGTGGGTFDIVVPAGGVQNRVGWSVNKKGTVWHYRDRNATQGEVTNVVVRDLSQRMDGLVRFTIRARGASALLPDVGAIAASVQLGNGAECATATWGPPAAARPRCKGDNQRLSCR